MTSLRQRMTEDMQVRNLALNTQTFFHLQQVSLFARHFNRSPELLGPEQIPATSSALPDSTRKLAPGSVLIAAAALRFLYKVSLHRNWIFGRMSGPGTEKAASITLARHSGVPRRFSSFSAAKIAWQEASRHFDDLPCRAGLRVISRRVRSHRSRHRQRADGASAWSRAKV